MEKLGVSEGARQQQELRLEVGAPLPPPSNMNFISRSQTLRVPPHIPHCRFISCPLRCPHDVAVGPTVRDK